MLACLLLQQKDVFLHPIGTFLGQEVPGQTLPWSDVFCWFLVLKFVSEVSDGAAANLLLIPIYTHSWVMHQSRPTTSKSI